MRLSSFLVLSTVMLSFALRAETATLRPKTTQDLIEQLGKDIAQVWADYPTDKQKAVREAKIVDLNTSFSKDLQKADAPPKFTIQRCLESFIDQIRKAN